jgi:predicted nucleotidyltransferase
MAAREQPSMRSIEEALSANLEKHRGIVSAYLFGSFAEKRSHADSDVDIGVLLDRSEYSASADRFEMRVRLAATLEHDLAPRSPDVVILNDAPPTLAARIVSSGQRLVCRSRSLDHAFRRDIQLRAADLQPFLRRVREVKLRSILRQ